MSRDLPVSQVMTTDVLSFSPEDNVRDAMVRLFDRGVDGAPVVDGSGNVVGMLSTGDLIVQDAQIHVPTVISLFGAYIELPSARKHFERDLEKALGATVGEVMTAEPAQCGPDDSLEWAATLMHKRDVSRLPVVDAGGRLVGIVSRVDILRTLIAE